MPRASTTGGGGGAGSKRAREDDDAQQAEAEALERLASVPQKLAGVVYAFTNGGAHESVARDDLLGPLEAIGCENPSNATQKNRIENYATTNWFEHNQGKGADARIGLTQDGVDAILELFTDEDDSLECDALEALMRAIRKATGAPAAAPLSQRKQPRAASSPAPAPVGAPEAVEAELVEEGEAGAVGGGEVEERADDEQDAQETEEDDSDVTIGELQERLDHLAKRFDERINKDSLAAAYGDLAADFLKKQSRVPTSQEGDKLLRAARDEMYAAMEVGDGHVKHKELVDVYRKLQEARKLAGEVLELEARMSTAK